MKQKIAIMVFSNVISGAESVVIHMLKNINKELFDVYFITCDELVNKVSIDGVTNYSVGKIVDRSFLFRAAKKILGSDLYYKLRLNKIVRQVETYLVQNGIGLVHSNLLLDHYVNSKLNGRIIKLMTMHGAHGLDGSSDGAFTPKTIKRIYENSSITFSACNYFINLLKKNRINVNSCIVPNGIDFDLLEEKRVQEKKDENLNIVYLGGTRDIKGWDILIEGMNIEVNKRNNKFIHLDILRDVPKQSRLYQLAEKYNLLNYITFSGYVSNNDHLKHVSACNLYTLPSYSEGIANTLTEAIGYEKPILATDVGGTSELVKHMVNGYLCDTTAQSVADGIQFFLDNKNKLNEFAIKNKEIGKQLAWTNVILLYEKEYRQFAVKV